MTAPPGLLDVARFAAFVGREPGDDAVHFAVELAETLIHGEVGAALTDPPQPGLTAVAFGVAARMLAGPIGVTAESEGGTSFSYAPGTGSLSLTPEEAATLHRLTGRRAGLGTIGLRSPGRGRVRFTPGRPDRQRRGELVEYPGGFFYAPEADR